MKKLYIVSALAATLALPATVMANRLSLDDILVGASPRSAMTEISLGSSVSPVATSESLRGKMVSTVTPVAVKAAAQASGEQVTPKVKIVAPSDEMMADFRISGVIFYNGVTENVMASVRQWDTEIEANGTMPCGEVEVTAVGTFMMYDFSAIGQCALYGKYNLTAEEPCITFDFADLKNMIRYTSLRPDGTEYPGLDLEDPENMDVANAHLDFFFPGGISGLEAFGFPQCAVWTNDMDCCCQTTWQVSYSGADLEACVAVASISGPYLESVTKTTDVDAYIPFDSSFSLTPTDLKASPSGTYFGMANVYDSSASMMYWQSFAEDGSHPTTARMKAVMPSEDDIAGSGLYEIGVLQGVVTGEGIVGNGYQVKESGLNFVIDGKPVVAPTRIASNLYPAEGELPFSFLDYPSVMLVEAPAEYFTMAPYSVSRVELWPDPSETDKLASISVRYNIYGPYNEGIDGIDPNGCLSAIKHEGKLLSSLANLPYSGLYELTFVYDNILVDKSVASSNEVTVGIVPGSEDAYAPGVSLVQVRDAEGRIANALDVNLGGTLYVGVSDLYEGADYEAVVSVAPQDGDDWSAIAETGSPELWPTSIGALYTYDLASAGLVDNTWYKVKVVATDAVGNYSEQIVNHCFHTGEASALGKVGVDNASPVVSSRYYDLSGRAVAEPAAGVFVKAETRADGSVTVSKVVGF